MTWAPIKRLLNWAWTISTWQAWQALALWTQLSRKVKIGIKLQSVHFMLVVNRQGSENSGSRWGNSSSWVQGQSWDCQRRRSQPRRRWANCARNWRCHHRLGHKKQHRTNNDDVRRNQKHHSVNEEQRIAQVLRLHVVVPFDATRDGSKSFHRVERRSQENVGAYQGIRSRVSRGSSTTHR